MREAIATIRLIGFDLLVVGFEDSRLDVWNLLHRVLTAWPHQRWILTSHHITAEDEIHARSMGALMVLDAVPDETWLADFAASLRHRDLSKSFSSLASADAFASSPHSVAMRVEAS